jgi:hypothetical protein
MTRAERRAAAVSVACALALFPGCENDHPSCTDSCGGAGTAGWAAVDDGGSEADSGALDADSGALDADAGLLDADGAEGCLVCEPAEDSGSSSSAIASEYEPAGHCFLAAAPLCAVCFREDPSVDAGPAPGARCIVSPEGIAYFAASAPGTVEAADGWFVSEVLVGTPSGSGAGDATTGKKALCATMMLALHTVPDGGFPSPWGCPP